MIFDLKEHSHRRYNALTGEWIQVSPHRAKRPWQGQIESTKKSNELKYDATCYLCPGNTRSNGQLNSDYKTTYSFINDFSAIIQDIPDTQVNKNDLLIARSEKGICKVICFSPDHSLTIAEMPTSNIVSIIEQWIEEYESLKKYPFISYIQIFENKGEAMGCSNPHPHGQIWAQESIPMEPLKKDIRQREYFKDNGQTLLSNYIKLELEVNERIVFENEHFVTVVPFWATWPFETMIVPRRPMADITVMSSDEINSFAEAISVITAKYDNLFTTSFPYSSGIHQAPVNRNENDHWHWHMVFYPPLLRSASVKKFMVGYEMLANPQRDATPELSAEQLRKCSAHHYKKQSVSYL